MKPFVDGIGSRKSTREQRIFLKSKNFDVDDCLEKYTLSNLYIFKEMWTIIFKVYTIR